MSTLLIDTLAALTAYGKMPDHDDINVLYWNDDLQVWQKYRWSAFTSIAATLPSQPNDIYDHMGIRLYRRTFYIVGDNWHLERSDVCHDFEGWLYIDEPIVEYLSCEDDDTIQSKYMQAADREVDRSIAQYYDNDVIPMIVGTDNRVYSSGYDQHGQHTSLMWHPDLIGMVATEQYLNVENFNADTINERLGFDTNYYTNDVGRLTLEYIPHVHFTVSMGASGDERVNITRIREY